MGAGCSAQTTAYDSHRVAAARQTSTTRLISAFGGIGTAGRDDQSDSQSKSPPHKASPRVVSPQAASPDLFPTPTPSPPHTPHILSPGVLIQPAPDLPLRQRQTIPPMVELDKSSCMARTRSEAPSSEKKAPPEPQRMLKSSTFPVKTLSTPTPNKKEEEVEVGMSRASSDEAPGSFKLFPPPEHNRRRNSISVLPSIDPKPKFPGSSGGEGKKTDPDLVLWISNKLKTKLKLARISKAYDRFIPSNFYSEMGKQDIREVDLGECVIVRKTILFCDIRNFTSFSSKIGPQDTFKFINAFSRRLLPVVRKHGGYIDKFIGDALVALFPDPVQGIRAGQDIQHTLEEYNTARHAKAFVAVRVGIGCHSGTLMLGTVGDTQRMDGIAIGNVISLASQVEMCTKLFGVEFVTTKVTFMGLKEEEKAQFIFRRLGRIKEGTDDDQLTEIYQVCPAKSPVSSIKERFEEGVNLFQQKDFAAAATIFRECIETIPTDKPSLVLENRAQHFLACTYLPADWGNALTYHTEFMTQSTPAGVLAHQPTTGGFPSMGGNPNLGLMRLVFSAIFHMQKKISENEDEEDEEEGAEKPKKNEGAGDTTLEVPTTTRAALPPLAPAKSQTNSAPGPPKTENPALQDTGKERELITLVLSGFENHNRVSYLTKAYQRFVPNDFLSYLGKDDVQHVDIGDSMMTNITTMFIEIHGFQPKSKLISEKTFNQLQSMKRYSDPSPTITSSPSLSSQTPSLPPTPSKRALGRMASRNTVNLRADLFSFQFLNTISQKLLPIIRQCDGYVDKFFGNAILALFPSLDAATSAGLQIMAAVKSFDVPDDGEEHHAPYAQIGMNSGNVILGTVGDGKRMDGTVIGNTVNVAARMLSLTKIYGTKFVTTSRCISQIGQPSSSSSSFSSHSSSFSSSAPSPPLTCHSPPTHAPSPLSLSSSPPKNSSFHDAPTQPKHPSTYKFYNQRVLDTVRVPGKEESLVIHEIFDNESRVAQIKPAYESALALYRQRKFAEALKLFEDVLAQYAEDVPSQMLRDRCVKCIKEGIPSDWDGVHVVSVK